MGTSSVDEVAAETVSIDFTTPEQLIVHGVAPGTPVTIYDTAGRMLTAAKAGDDHTASLCIGALPKSTIYIVSVSNTKNFKFIKQ